MYSQQNSCEVCAILPQNEPLLETTHWMVSLSPDQGYLGRAYVTTKRHVGDLADLNEHEWAEFPEVLRRYESAVRAAFGAELFNWGCLMNNAYQKDPSLPHVHWHVRPRYRNEVTVGGEVFVDPQFGHHYDREQKKLVSKATLETIHGALQ